jgi:hypothetical protein
MRSNKLYSSDSEDIFFHTELVAYSDLQTALLLVELNDFFIIYEKLHVENFPDICGEIPHREL